MSMVPGAPDASLLTRFIDAFSAFIDLTATAVDTAIASGRARLGRLRAVRIEEGEDGAFHLPGAGPFHPDPGDMAPAVPPEVTAALRGREVELALDPARFLFRPLDLPEGARPYLDGIVRAQIDRLTPWSAAEAAFGWTAPEPLGDGRIRLMVAATPRARLAPALDALKALGVGHLLLTTRQGAEEPITVHAGASGEGAGTARLRKVLLGVLAASALAATLASGVSGFLGASLDEEQQTLDQAIATRRRVIAAARDGLGAEGAALRGLEQAKRERAPTVLVLEALSQVLPDHTYLTALTIQNGKVELTGVSREAPSLVRLLEDSKHFSAATFVAPTTRQPGDAGERFQIQADISLPFEVTQ
ncbi:general secretion pathway protein L [Xanthobacter flavus]|uniref:General secretion pathway protein L n=2 Tax=Xanthobacter flavus TaxID=281 RepID=A0ABU1KKX7_XANFL|nr:PilN domain-containing protein [Xanthobacter flavus]MDR6335265.1 general secretion pathway protein L [Xanthobacter flavus]